MADALVDDVDLHGPARSGALRRFTRHRLALYGVIVIAFLLVGSACANWLAPFDPDEIDIVNRYAPPLSPGHWLGADDLGQQAAEDSEYRVA